MKHPALAHLPPAVFALAPELAAIDLPSETLATCDDCAAGAAAQARSPMRPFDRTLKCCTFWPEHPNWLVGRSLRRDDEGANRVRALIQAGDTVRAIGLGRPAGWLQRYLDEAETAFGVDETLLCPYYNRPNGSCTVWRDRGSICRTWHCKSVDGPRGRRLWRHIARILKMVEESLALWCLAAPDAPADETLRTDPGRAEAWYRTCADRVEQASPADILGFRSEELGHRARALLRIADQVEKPVPTWLGPSVGWMVDDEDPAYILLGGQSPLQLLRLPRTIFQLLSRLDGRTAWPDALRASECAMGDRYPEGIVERLYRAGILEERDPNERDPPPGYTMRLRPEPLFDD
jgi:hypothetical protein